MPTTTPHNPLTVLQQLVDAYDALQATDGAGVYLDASRTYTVGQWLGSRMAGLVDHAKSLLEDFDFASKDREIAVCLVDESGANVGRWTEDGFCTPLVGGLEDHAQDPADDETTLVCAICGNKASGTIDKLADEGWIPEYWVDEDTSDGPACPGCVKYRMIVGSEDGGGKLVLLPEEDWKR